MGTLEQVHRESLAFLKKLGQDLKLWIPFVLGGEWNTDGVLILTWVSGMFKQSCCRHKQTEADTNKTRQSNLRTHKRRPPLFASEVHKGAPEI